MKVKRCGRRSTCVKYRQQRFRLIMRNARWSLKSLRLVGEVQVVLPRMSRLAVRLGFAVALNYLVDYRGCGVCAELRG